MAEKMIKVIPDFNDSVMGYKFSKGQENSYPEDMINILQKAKGLRGVKAYPMTVRIMEPEVISGEKEKKKGKE